MSPTPHVYMKKLNQPNWVASILSEILVIREMISPSTPLHHTFLSHDCTLLREAKVLKENRYFIRGLGLGLHTRIINWLIDEIDNDLLG